MPLTDKQIKSLQPGEKARKYFDGGGMYLEVAPSGGKWWRLKYRFQGKDKRISLGTYPAVSLKEARDAAQDVKRLLREGRDPSLCRRMEATVDGRTFDIVALEWLEKNRPQWSDGYAEKVRSRLEGPLFSALGKNAISSIIAPEILALCRSVEAGGSPYMAHSTLGLVSRIFRYGVACGYVQSDPCRDLRGALAPHKERHMPAVTSALDAGKLAARIDSYEGRYITRCAMQLLLLCMCRTQEIRGMRWSEISVEERLWRIPAARMKSGREHLVPLSQQALGVLESLQPVSGQYAIVFPSYCRGRGDTPLGKNTINNALRVMGYGAGEVVGHGFRSTASTLLNELGWSPDVIEAQLAHADTNKVRAAYNRAAYLDDRRRMLQAWADYLDSLKERSRRS